MMPSKDKTITVDPAILDDATSMHAASIEKDSITPATRLENSFIVSLIIGILGLIFISYYIITHGFQLNLNIVNFTFLFLGILCHWTPKRFLDAVATRLKEQLESSFNFLFMQG